MVNLDLVNTSLQTKVLYQQLIKLGVDVKIELYNGIFTVDLAVPSKKINIELDGGQHMFNLEQAFSDLNRTFYAYKYGYFTLRVPNVCVDQEPEKTALMVKRFIDEF